MILEADGCDVCTHLRELSDVPVLMLTARSIESDMLSGSALLQRREIQNIHPEIKPYTDKGRIFAQIMRSLVKVHQVMIGNQ